MKTSCRVLSNTWQMENSRRDCATRTEEECCKNCDPRGELLLIAHPLICQQNIAVAFTSRFFANEVFYVHTRM